MFYTFKSKINKESGKVKVAHSCLTLCSPMDFTVHGILQARKLEWVAFPSSKVSSQPRDRTQVSCTAGGFFTNLKPNGKKKRERETNQFAVFKMNQIIKLKKKKTGLILMWWNRSMNIQLQPEGNGMANKP